MSSIQTKQKINWYRSALEREDLAMLNQRSNGTFGAAGLERNRGLDRRGSPILGRALAYPVSTLYHV